MDERSERASPYTKRMLPPFVIPECNIRLDLVLRLRQQHTANRSARGNAYALIGSVCERTIARHLRWAQEHSAATLLEVNEWVAELAPFAALPAVRVGAAGLRQLRRSVAALEAARRAGLGATGVAFTVLGCVPPALRVRACPESPRDSIESSITRRLLVRYQLSIPSTGGITWMHYWFPPTVWRSWSSSCC